MKTRDLLKYINIHLVVQYHAIEDIPRKTHNRNNTQHEQDVEKDGRVGFRAWSMRGVEDEAGVPHGSARHYFANQRGLIVEVVRHLLDGDLPRPGETPKQQVARWLGPESGRTRARYELIIASFHDPDLAVELVRGRDRFVDILAERGMTSSDATELVAALDGVVLDALLREQAPEGVDPERIFKKFGAKFP
ncbi:TetR/AcrR family transcriptional regulator [Rhodococcus erythropolis]|uniref:TetR/AcrR family transcriptional regulator n=2 Tax=Nocardiaceae TaxID=85025 RepID=UPI00210C1CAB|nr:TetR/AcrR family transcriptional regulator [Rhodococcus erythropolis]MCQ4123845.1 TetR/AcrR family transcriptional regulator [Rhodococcus erythropolis]